MWCDPGWVGRAAGSGPSSLSCALTIALKSLDMPLHPFLPCPVLPCPAPLCPLLIGTAFLCSLLSCLDSVAQSFVQECDGSGLPAPPTARLKGMERTEEIRETEGGEERSRENRRD